MDMCDQLNPTYLLTATFERKTSFYSVHKSLAYLTMKMDKLMLGDAFYRHASAERSRGIAFLEHLETNTHAHAVISTPNDAILLRKFDYLNEIWHRRTQMGSLHLVPITRTPRRLFFVHYQRS